MYGSFEQEVAHLAFDRPGVGAAAALGQALTRDVLQEPCVQLGQIFSGCLCELRYRIGYHPDSVYEAKPVGSTPARSAAACIAARTA